MSELEEQIGQWRSFVSKHREVSASDADELEDHLRSTVAELEGKGLRPDEAFLVAVKRMGSLDELSREFAREHSDRLWKQLVLSGQSPTVAAQGARRDWLVMLVCAAVAAVSIKIPVWLGYDWNADMGVFMRNIGLFAFTPLAAYLVWRRRPGAVTIVALVLLFGLGVLGANIYPLTNTANTTILTMVHLPLALWLAVGIAYVGREWNLHRRWMDFIRFTGEFFIYYVLIALGGGVLTAIAGITFNTIGVDLTTFLTEWLLPCGAMAAVVVAAWLVEAKQSVIENMAPVLTRLFTPLFTVLLIAFVIAIFATGHGIDVNRNVLILFNFVLVVVLGLLLYSISARDPMARPGMFDRLQFALLISALAIDVLVLLAVAGRTADAFGFTANRVAALGENAVLLGNLLWSAVLLGGFLAGRALFSRLERWQTTYLPVYAVWAWIVVLAFPPIFHYV